MLKKPLRDIVWLPNFVRQYVKPFTQALRETMATAAAGILDDQGLCT